MKGINIIKRKNNMELLSKLMNSVAVKYDCAVKYNRFDNSLSFLGNEAFREHIAQETADLFTKKQYA